MDELTDDEGDGSSLAIRAKLLVNSCDGHITVEKTSPELPLEKLEELLDFSRHFEYQGVVYEIKYDLPQQNGGGNLHYRFLEFRPIKGLSVDDIVF